MSHLIKRLSLVQRHDGEPSQVLSLKTSRGRERNMSMRDEQFGRERETTCREKVARARSRLKVERSRLCG